jgi:hypothetical protein
MRNWKWLRYYKKTKRSYLDQRKKIMNRSLKSDVFVSLKIYRQEIYNFAHLIGKFIDNRKYFFARFSMSKIINVASM